MAERAKQSIENINNGDSTALPNELQNSRWNVYQFDAVSTKGRVTMATNRANRKGILRVIRIRVRVEIYFRLPRVSKSYLRGDICEVNGLVL